MQLFHKQELIQLQPYALVLVHQLHEFPNSELCQSLS